MLRSLPQSRMEDHCNQCGREHSQDANLHAPHGCESIVVQSNECVCRVVFSCFHDTKVIVSVWIADQFQNVTLWFWFDLSVWWFCKVLCHIVQDILHVRNGVESRIDQGHIVFFVHAFSLLNSLILSMVQVREFAAIRLRTIVVRHMKCSWRTVYSNWRW